MTNTSLSTQYPAECQDIQEIVGSYYLGIAFSRLSLLERSYQQKFNKPLDCKSFGVDTLEELLSNMPDKLVVLPVEPGSKEKYVLSVRMVEWRQNVFLKHCVQELLDENCGEIVFHDFEGLYEDKFGVSFEYDYYCLTDLLHLCDVLNDILVVEFLSLGKRVMKAVKKDIPVVGVANSSRYNLRKRKRE